MRIKTILGSEKYESQQQKWEKGKDKNIFNIIDVTTEKTIILTKVKIKK